MAIGRGVNQNIFHYLWEKSIRMKRLLSLLGRLRDDFPYPVTAGAGKKVVVYIPEMVEPELMYKLFTAVCNDIDSILECLQ